MQRTSTVKRVTTFSYWNGGRWIARFNEYNCRIRVYDSCTLKSAELSYTRHHDTAVVSSLRLLYPEVLSINYLR